MKQDQLAVLSLTLAGLIGGASSPLALAQVPESPETPQITELELLEICARDEADQLPSPFVDVQPTDWAYKAVLTLYYCGAYRGAIPPETYKEYLDQQTIPDQP